MNCYPNRQNHAHEELMESVTHPGISEITGKKLVKGALDFQMFQSR